MITERGRSAFLPTAALAAGATVVAVLRLLAIRYDWSLPRWRVV